MKRILASNIPSSIMQIDTDFLKELIWGSTLTKSLQRVKMVMVDRCVGSCCPLVNTTLNLLLGVISIIDTITRNTPTAARTSAITSVVGNCRGKPPGISGHAYRSVQPGLQVLQVDILLV